MEVGTCLHQIRDIRRDAPGCRVVVVDEPADWNDTAGYEPDQLPVLKISVDRESREVALHTEADEDGPYLAPVPMLLSDLIAELEQSAEETFEMYWVGGFILLPEEKFGVEDGEGPFRARLAASLIGILFPEDRSYIAFMRKTSASSPRRIMHTTSLLWLLALVAGALIPVQAAANAALSRSIRDNVPFAALTLFLVAGAATALAVVVARQPIPTVGTLRTAPWWSYLGGLIVAFYVFSITFLAPRIGIGAAISLVVTGQILAALTIDHFGLLRSLTFPLTPVRLLGAALMGVGVFLALRR